MNNRKLPLNYIYDSQSERASVSTSVKGSITVEAAMAVPVFFFAVLCLFYLMEIMSVQTAVRSGLQDAGKLLAEQGYDQQFLLPSKVESDVVSSIGAERLQEVSWKAGAEVLTAVSHTCPGGQELHSLRQYIGFGFRCRFLQYHLCLTGKH